MTNKLIEIERMLCGNRVEEAYDTLQILLKQEPTNSQAWYLLGNLFRRHQMWGDAINAYNQAKLIEPDGPAAIAIEAIYDILRYRNTDLINP